MTKPSTLVKNMEFCFLRTNISPLLVQTHKISRHTAAHDLHGRMETIAPAFFKSYFVHLTDSMVQNVFLLWFGDTCVFSYMCFVGTQEERQKTVKAVL